MARSFADFRSPQSGPWTKTLSLGARIFDFYKSQGDLVVPAAGLTIPNTEDGPITISRYRRLEINGAFTKEHRDRGWCILCDDLVLGAGARPNMEGKGAAGSPKWAIQDITIPSAITLSGHRTHYDDFAAWVRERGYALFDPTLFSCPLPGMPDIQADYAEWPGRGTAIVSAAGCGSRTGRYYGASRDYGSGTAAIGPGGNAGSSAPGGGGGGADPVPKAWATAVTGMVGTTGSRGFPWGGGIRGLQGVYNTAGTDNFVTSTTDGDGDPYDATASPRPGGVLIILVRSNITAASGHSITASATSNGVGGGHGGGRVFLARGGSLSGTLNMAANGGGAASYCGPGGAGAVTSTTLAAMGWS